jgi:hypothetical protein
LLPGTPAPPQASSSGQGFLHIAPLYDPALSISLKQQHNVLQALNPHLKRLLL